MIMSQRPHMSILEQTPWWRKFSAGKLLDFLARNGQHQVVARLATIPPRDASYLLYQLWRALVANHANRMEFHPTYGRITEI